MSKGLNEALNHSSQPYLIGTGTSKKEVVNFYIAVGEDLLPCASTSLISAVDELFKSHFVLKTKFDDSLRSFWTFIQEEIYNLQTTVAVS